MKGLLEAMKRYIANTPVAEIEKAWSKYDIPENKVGPTMEHFLEQSMLHHFSSEEPTKSSENLINTTINSKFTSGFFFTKHSAISWKMLPFLSSIINSIKYQ